MEWCLERYESPAEPYAMTSSTSRYTQIQARLAEGGRVVLDGGTGTELERRGVSMDSQTWCGTAALDNIEVLEAIHRDYVTAQADVITANTYASSRLMLDLAGLGNQFETVNKAAVRAALRVRDHAGRNDVLVAGSLSHRIAINRLSYKFLMILKKHLRMKEIYSLLFHHERT